MTRSAVRAGGHPPRLLPVPHDAGRGPRARRPTSRAGTRCFEQHMLKTVERWMALADEKLHDKASRASCAPATTTSSRSTTSSAGRRVGSPKARSSTCGGFQLASTGWANRTPWDTYREEDEPDLAERIAAVTDQLTAAPSGRSSACTAPRTARASTTPRS